MSKFDLMAHGELRCLNAFGLRNVILQFMGTSSLPALWMCTDISVRSSLPDELGSNWCLDGIIVDDCAVFLIRGFGTGNTLKIRHTHEVMMNIKDDDRPLIAVDIVRDKLHQIIDHSIDAHGLNLMLDQGNPMSAELVQLWSPSGPMSKYRTHA
jgi:hypothetical protein